MKYSDEKVEKLIDFLSDNDEEGFCPSRIGLKDTNKCVGTSCKYCWQQALAGDD